MLLAFAGAILSAQFAAVQTTNKTGVDKMSINGLARYKISKTTATGAPAFRTLMVIKTFKTKNAMDVFLNRQTDNKWRPINTDKATGTYAHIAGAWHNINNLPAGVR